MGSGKFRLWELIGNRVQFGRLPSSLGLVVRRPQVNEWLISKLWAFSCLYYLFADHRSPHKRKR